MRLLFCALTAVLCEIFPASADDTFRIAVGQRGLWDTSVVELGQRAGIFRNHGVTLDILYTQGGGETQQAVISGSVDLGASAGSLGVFSAFVKQYGLKAKPVATGSPPATLTQVMSGQIDVGWAGPPFGLDLIDQGKIRIIANGNDAAALKNQTVRVLIANAATLQSRQPAVDRFMKAYRETVDWMYADSAVFRHYAEFMGIGEATMRRARDGFYPKATLDPDAIVGIDAINADAVGFKYMAAPLTREQLGALIRIPPR